MAAWLTLLRTRLLLPDLPDQAAQAEAAGLRQRLADRDAARRLADPHSPVSGKPSAIQWESLAARSTGSGLRH